MKEVIHTSNAPAAIGPYSQAIKAGGAIYVSGQLPVDPATGAFAGDTIQEQTRQSLTNIKNILAEAGTDLDHVVRVDVFMKDMNMFADMNAVYAEFFTEKCPARAAVEVARLPKDALVEIPPETGSAPTVSGGISFIVGLCHGRIKSSRHRTDFLIFFSTTLLS